MRVSADVSNYTGELTPARLQELKDLGVDKVIVQIVDPPAGYPVTVWRQQLLAAWEFGFQLEAYVYLWNSLSFEAQIERAEEKMLVEGWGAAGDIKRLWYDIEDTSYALPKSTLAELMVRAFNSQARWPNGLYTGKWYTDANLPANWQLPAHVPLWTAEYDHKPDTKIWTPYLGVSSLYMKQYEGSRELPSGGQIDLNVYDEAPTSTTMPPLVSLPATQRTGLVGKLWAKEAVGAYATTVESEWRESPRGPGWVTVRADFQL